MLATRLSFYRDLSCFKRNRFFPSSKTCNHCLNLVDSLPLDVRNWTCQSCQTQHDCDGKCR
ncbi:MAG: hypothetical protein BRC39_06215 [Cyanobacteria bacterium QH_7_48_89]|nr:MAG: hypothetical protein BRC39_06215 [Cyanobacteria bacterium QH_7_48_89]